MNNPYNELCPACGSPAVSRCRCMIGDFTCSKGHQWHKCSIHKTRVMGEGHGKVAIGGCTCGVARKLGRYLGSMISEE